MKHTAAAVAFSTGYMANTGTIAALAYVPLLRQDGGAAAGIRRAGDGRPERCAQPRQHRRRLSWWQERGMSTTSTAIWTPSRRNSGRTRANGFSSSPTASSAWTATSRLCRASSSWPPATAPPCWWTMRTPPAFWAATGAALSSTSAWRAAPTSCRWAPTRSRTAAWAGSSPPTGPQQTTCASPPARTCSPAPSAVPGRRDPQGDGDRRAGAAAPGAAAAQS